MPIYDLIFYVMAAITVLSALITVTSKNIVYSAFSLMFTLLGVAGLYILLGADFIGIVQLLVYVGGILILMLFGIMITNKITSVEIKTGFVNLIPGVAAVLLFLAALVSTVIKTEWKINPGEIPSTTITGIGRLLLSEYVILFEVLAVLLLIALIGAASLARRTK